ncbi:hypothetical protein HaLaN_19486, partial [Haematococcus lacustris]
MANKTRWTVFQGFSAPAEGCAPAAPRGPYWDMRQVCPWVMHQTTVYHTSRSLA